MKRKSLLFLSSFLMIGSLVGVAGCSSNNGFVLRAINPENRWSDRGMGFFFEFDPSAKLGDHKVTDIEFTTSIENVTIEKVTGEGDDYLKYEWRAMPKTPEVGSFTLVANIGDYKSNTLTFTTKAAVTFNFECNIPNGTEIVYSQTDYNGGSTTKYYYTYTLTKLNDSYMLSWESLFRWSRRPQTYYEHRTDGKFSVYAWNIDGQKWEKTSNVLTESEVLSKDHALNYLCPNPLTKTEDYSEKEEVKDMIDGKDYTVTRLQYYFENTIENYRYLNDNGLKLLTFANIHARSSYAQLIGCCVDKINHPTAFPYDAPIE